MRPRMVISGGQTGADRGGLDAAIACNVDHSGFVCCGRSAEDGIVPEKYDLIELADRGYPARTLANVQVSDGTVVFTRGGATQGSRLTLKFCDAESRFSFHANLIPPVDFDDFAGRIRHWVARNGIKILNVAGSRESKAPGIEQEVREIMWRVLQ